ncbi:BMC domain-containing protein [uncultured Acetobacterium sp.]|uniref:BMC domain-containing protein n=1 Tax=uncultured Acetobacterium sp. TaxID=217139 RepID=UPI002600E6D2|nr:BMC domain-containing protein [uncultured Acetobacterium sp.]
MLKCRFISSPDESTMDLLRNRVRTADRKKIEHDIFGAIGLVQANVSSLFVYADIAVKSADVIVLDIVGNCTQTMSTIAFLGTMESVKSALTAIKQERDD